MFFGLFLIIIWSFDEFCIFWVALLFLFLLMFGVGVDYI